LTSATHRGHWMRPRARPARTVLPEARQQRCTAHLMRNVFSHVPQRQLKHLARELHRLPAYSPEFMAMEGVWKTTRELTTHNTFLVAAA
jgi:hypothetical protein